MSRAADGHLSLLGSAAHPGRDAPLERIGVTDMTHGTRIDPGSGADRCGTPDQYVINVDVCSSSQIASVWGLGG